LGAARSYITERRETRSTAAAWPVLKARMEVLTPVEAAIEAEPQLATAVRAPSSSAKTTEEKATPAPVRPRQSAPSPPAATAATKKRSAESETGRGTTQKGRRRVKPAERAMANTVSVVAAWLTKLRGR